MGAVGLRSFELLGPAYQLYMWAKADHGLLIGACVESALCHGITLREGMVFGMENGTLDLIAQKAKELGVLIRIEKK